MKRPVRILFTVDSFYNGGTETSLLEILSRLHCIEPVVCGFYEHGHLAPAFQDAGIRIHWLRQRHRYGFGRATQFLEKVIEIERPALVVAHLLRSELITRWVCRNRSEPVIGTFVNDTYSAAADRTRTNRQRIAAEVFRTLNRTSAKWCAHFIANSRAIKDSNGRALGVSADRISVVHRGRDPERYYRKSIAPGAAIRSVVSVGRLLERKGHRELIRAFARVVPRYPGLRLKIAGEGVFRPVLEREIAAGELGDHIELLGNVPDVACLLREADLFVLASHYEGFSGALVEAMLTGLPIVASDIPMNLEAVEDGRTAACFPTGDVESLAARLRWCVENPAEARMLGSVARSVALERFTIDRAAAEFENVLLRIADENRSATGIAMRRGGVVDTGVAP